MIRKNGPTCIAVGGSGNVNPAKSGGSGSGSTADPESGPITGMKM
jgi:hypothetical protein